MPAASVRAAAGALTFLTRIPIGHAVALDAVDVARGAALFPAVGAGIGALGGATAVLLHPQVPALAAAGIAIAVTAVVTGAMHLDALADTADALGAHTRDAALAIMRDSRVGAFGVTALVLDVLVKGAALAALLDRGEALAAFVAAGALSRAASPPLAATLPYPRAEDGPGSVLTGRVGPAAAAVGAVVAVAVAALAAGTNGLLMAAAVAVSTLALGLVYRAWLGGATGDCLGTAAELAETVALTVAAALA
jgi:adenosylcobinamide-GDP ribazoletransferase